MAGALAASLAFSAACARQEAPPGAVPETRPPEVARLFPALDTVIEDLGDAARVRFDEPISAPGNLSRQLVASPAYEYTVEAGHGDIRVRPREGWRPGAVYVLVLDAGVSDLLNNAREEPIRWRFSTGPPVAGTAVTGRIWDRVTGELVEEARALFLSQTGDSIPYTAVSDTGGSFRLEAVPPDSYRAYAFRDRNRNRTLDRRLEGADSVSFTLDGPSGRAEIEFVLVEPDSTPPVLGLAEATDSTTVRLTFDDHLRPGVPPPPDSMRLVPADGEERWPVDSARVLEASRAEASGRGGPAGGAQFDPRAARGGLGEDTAVGPAAPDTAAPGVPDTAAAAVPDTAAPAGRDTAAASPVGPLPSRTLELYLGAALAPADTYRIRVRGVLNLQGLAGGGDTVFVYTPPADTTSAGDTSSVVRDSVVIPPDTGNVARDTSVVRTGSATGDTATANPPLRPPRRRP